MTRFNQKIGLFSSLIAALSFLLFTICFATIAATQEVSAWTSLDNYLEGIRINSQLYKYVAQICSIIFGVSYLIIINCFSEIVSPEKQILQKLSVSFGIIFTTLIGINYFLQITAVQFNLQQGVSTNISNWIMFNPNSMSLAIAMLGWTFMFGLSSLFAAPIFEGKGIRRSIRILFILNGICCLLGGIGFVIQNANLVNLTINLGMGGIMTILMIVLSIFFWNEKATLQPNI